MEAHNVGMLQSVQQARFNHEAARVHLLRHGHKGIGGRGANQQGSTCASNLGTEAFHGHQVPGFHPAHQPVLLATGLKDGPKVASPSLLQQLQRGALSGG
jgi:hypothetical protein